MIGKTGATFDATLETAMKLTNPFYNEDKSLKLYKQNYRKGHPSYPKQNPTWYARVKLGRGISAQLFSTGTRSDTEAYRIGTERLAELRARHAVGISIYLSKFSEIARQHLNDLKQQRRENICSLEKYELHKRTINKQLNPYFKDLEIAKVTSKHIDQYFNKRSKDSVIHIKKDDHGNDIETKLNRRIGNSHLNKEGQVIRAILKLAMQRGVITTMPIVKHHKSGRDDLREGLSIDEWEHLKDYLDNRFVDQATNQPAQDLARFYRQVFVNWAKLVVYTGLRTTEALKLRWEDWETGTEQGIQIGWLTVRAIEKGARKTQTSRRFKITKRVNELLAYQRAITDYADKEDYIFTHPKSKKLGSGNITTFKKNFNTALEACGLLYGDNGKKRTPYILRHTHAHLMRQAGKPIDDIADDIGNLATTAQRFYIGRNTGDRKGLPIDIE